jgi:predicted metalloprotease with PDZ domain
VGLLLASDGTITDVVRNSAAWRAGLGPGMKVLAVNGHSWSSEALRQAIASEGNVAAPLHVVVQTQSRIFETAMEIHVGLRYPRLDRNSYADTLSEILKPRVAAGITP